MAPNTEQLIHVIWAICVLRPRDFSILAVYLHHREAVLRVQSSIQGRTRGP